MIMCIQVHSKLNRKRTRTPRDADPVVYHYPTRVRIGCALMNACDWLAPRMGTVTTPLLVFHSENDTCVWRRAACSLFTCV